MAAKPKRPLTTRWNGPGMLRRLHERAQAGFREELEEERAPAAQLAAVRQRIKARELLYGSLDVKLVGLANDLRRDR